MKADTTTLAPTDAVIWREWELILATSNPTAGTAAIKLARTAIAKWGAPAPASGEVVVTCAPCGRCVAVTRQDDEGRILSVIWVEPTQDEPILRTAAQSLIDRWDTPLWKDAEHTGAFIQRLREALAAPPAQEARVPLTSKECRDMLEEVDHYNFAIDLIRAVEKHHGITAAQKETP